MALIKRLVLAKGGVFALACLAATTSLAAQQLSVSAEQIQAMGIRTASVQTNPDSVKMRYPAQVTVPPGAEQIVTTPVQALVVQLLVSEFQPVAKGDPLAKLSSPAMSELQLSLLQASARASLARQAYKREKTLFDEGIIPQRRAQEADAALKEAVASLSQVRSALLLAGLTKEAADKVIASGIPSDTVVLRAIQDGVVTNLNIKPGQRVDAVSPLLSIAQVRTLWLDIQLPASAAPSATAGTPVQVVGREVSGEIKSVSPTVSDGNQFVVMRAEIKDSNGQLRPGEYVSVDVPLATQGSTWDLPLTALARNKDDSVVFVRNDKGFTALPVEVQASAGQFVRIRGNIQPMDQIAVSGVIALKGAWLKDEEVE